MTDGRPTREAVIERWRRHVAGVIALGAADVHRLHAGPIRSAEAYGAVLANVNDEAVKLIGQLYDAIMPLGEAAAANGKPQTQRSK